jgi:hypothetical protein
LASSSATRLATTHFSEQVFTKSRYFCRLSKKRKLRCGSSGPRGTARPSIGVARGGAAARLITSGRDSAGLPALFAMKARMRSSVSVVMRPPLRRRLASLPSLTARRPKVDSASPVWRQKSEISCRIASFMAGLETFRSAPPGLWRRPPAFRPRRSCPANQVDTFPSTTKRPTRRVGSFVGNGTKSSKGNRRAYPSH